ncbi:MAG: tail fiber domain-containing protein, partial [Saprospiraceae bacterium]
NAFSFPTTDGSNGQVLVTNGSGVLTWSSITNTDNQALSLSGNTLTLANGGTVDLSAFANTDNQALSLSGNTLTLANGGTVDLSAFANDNTTIVQDSDNDTKIQVEETADEDIIRFDLSGTEGVVIRKNTDGDPRLELITGTNYNTFLGYGTGANNSGTRNTFVGHNSGNSNTTGEYNTLIGSFAGKNNTTGGSNTFIGRNTGFNNTTGSANTFMGQSAGLSNTTGNYGTFIGYEAGANSTNSWNTFIGHQTGLSNTSGFSNVGLGWRAGYSTTTGDKNTNIGTGAGFSNVTGTGNTFLGYFAGYNETGSNKLYIANSNTSSPLLYGEFDNSLLRVNGTLNINNEFSFPTTDGSNGQILVTNGSGSLTWSSIIDTDKQDLGLSGNNLTITNGLSVDLSAYANENTTLLQDADNDTKIQVEETADEDIIRFDIEGSETVVLKTNAQGDAMIELESTYANTFIGKDAGRVTQSTVSNNGRQNNFIGASAGYSNTTGYQNVFIGNETGYNNTIGNDNIFIGHEVGYNTTKGENNVYIGDQAGYNNITGNSNVLLGNRSGYNETGSNKLYIENSNTSSPLIYGEFDNNEIVINGNNTHNTSNYTFYVNGTAGGSSAWNNSSDRRLKENIQTVDNALDKITQMRGVTYEWKDGREAGSRLGFIAQEVEDILPQVVDTTGDYRTMQYAPITAVLVEAVKEQQAQIESLKAENATLKAQVNTIAAQNQKIAELEAMFQKMQTQINKVNTSSETEITEK